MNKLMVFMLLHLFVSNIIALETEFDTRQQAEGLNEQFDQVIYIDHDLNRIELATLLSRERKVVKVTTERFGAKKTETGMLRAWAVLKNRTDYALQVEGRVIFFDQDLLPIDDVTAWKRMYLPANGIGTYRDTSISFDAAHYMIELREAR